MKRIRVVLVVLALVSTIGGCDAVNATGANTHNPPSCNPEFPTMGSGC
jgi:hypothetical protein